MREYYNNDNNKLCHAVKDGNLDAIKQMARKIVDSENIPPNAILIPAPQHTGRASYTLHLADEISALTGAAVCNALACKPHESLYDAKYNNHDVKLEFSLIKTIPPNKPLYFVDNVISTGKTFATARDVIGDNLHPLAYAVDSTRLDEKYHVFDSKEDIQIMITCNKKDFERLPTELKELNGELSKADYELAAFRYPCEDDNIPLDLCFHIPPRMYCDEELETLYELAFNSMELGCLTIDGYTYAYDRLSAKEIDGNIHLFPSAEYLFNTKNLINSSLSKSGLNAGVQIDGDEISERHFDFYLETQNGMDMISLNPNQCTLSTIIHAVTDKIEDFEINGSSKNLKAWRKVLSELEYMENSRIDDIEKRLSGFRSKNNHGYKEMKNELISENESNFEEIDTEARRMAEYGNNKEFKLRDRLWGVAIVAKRNSGEKIDIQEAHCHIEHLINEIMQNEMKNNPVVKGRIQIDGVDVNIQGIDDMTEKEVRNYITLSRIQKCSPGETLAELKIYKSKDDKVALSYNIKSLPFERIRRITGYLVGSIDRWNNAKRAEEHDRVKHTLGR